MGINWPVSRPAMLPTFPFRTEVARLVRRNVRDKAELVKLAERIYDFIRVPNFRLALHSFFCAALSIDDAKVSAIGMKSSTAISNFIIRALGFVLASKMDTTGADVNLIGELERELENPSDQIEGWVFPKVYNLSHALRCKRETERFVDMLHLLGTEQMLELVRRNAGDTNELIRSVMDEMLTLRRYGVKSSFFQDGIIHPSGSAWVFVDASELKDAFRNGIDDMANQLAVVSLADRTSITDLKIQIGERRVGFGKMHGGAFPFKGWFSWEMARDAEFAIVNTSGIVSVRDIFERRGKAILYEVVRIAHMLRLYDLIVPTTVVRTMPPLPQDPGLLGRIIRRVKIITPDLIIPRVRKLDDFSSLVSELEIELELAEEETIRRAERRYHEVIHHIRTLPLGHHPSAEARASAMEDFAIELADNETFVRKHHRGKGEVIAMHRARQRGA